MCKRRQRAWAARRLISICLLVLGMYGCTEKTTAPRSTPGKVSPTRAVLLASPVSTAAVTANSTSRPTSAPRTCNPTHNDGVSPTYKPGVPVRNVVGKGHVLTGIVRSSQDCAPIAGAKLEFWPEEAGLGHPDSSRATLFSDGQGRYRFECNLPDHIHMRISAPGYRTIGVNSYHPDGQAEGSLDFVLEPEGGSILNP